MRWVPIQLHARDLAVADRYRTGHRALGEESWRAPHSRARRAERITRLSRKGLIVRGRQQQIAAHQIFEKRASRDVAGPGYCCQLWRATSWNSCTVTVRVPDHREDVGARGASGHQRGEREPAQRRRGSRPQPPEYDLETRIGGFSAWIIQSYPSGRLERLQTVRGAVQQGEALTRTRSPNSRPLKNRPENSACRPRSGVPRA